MTRKQPLETRFWAKVNRSGECWMWTAAKLRRGYGCIQVNGKLHKAHRVAYELTYGAIPDGLCVCHHCDTPSCCNPEHLFLGTQIENVADRHRKGRTRAARGTKHGTRTHPEQFPWMVTPPDHQGEKNGRARLNDEQVLTIRAAFATGTVTIAGIARQYAVGHSTISNIVHNRTWKHLLPTHLVQKAA